MFFIFVLLGAIIALFSRHISVKTLSNIEIKYDTPYNGNSFTFLLYAHNLSYYVIIDEDFNMDLQYAIEENEFKIYDRLKESYNIARVSSKSNSVATFSNHTHIICERCSYHLIKYKHPMCKNEMFKSH